MSNFAESGQNTKKEINKPPPPTLLVLILIANCMEKKKQLHGSFFLKKSLKTIIEFLKTLP